MSNTTLVASGSPDDRNDRFVRPMELADYADRMGKAIAHYCSVSLDAAPAVAMTIYQMGITPLDYIRTYHTIQGKPCMRADAMLAAFNRKGYEHEVVETSPQRVCFAFWKSGDPSSRREVEWTWEQAQQSRWPWKNPADHTKGLKDNWSTPEDQENMMWARLVSKTIRRVEPSINSGIYTPEEIIDATDYRVISSDLADSEKKPRPRAADVVAAPEHRTLTAETVVEPVDVDRNTVEQDVLEGEVIDQDEALPEPSPDSVLEQAAPWEDKPAEETKPAADRITPAQKEKIEMLWEALQVSFDARTGQLNKRGVSLLQDLSKADAADLIKRLEGVAAAQGK